MTHPARHRVHQHKGDEHARCCGWPGMIGAALDHSRIRRAVSKERQRVAVLVADDAVQALPSRPTFRPIGGAIALIGVFHSRNASAFPSPTNASIHP